MIAEMAVDAKVTQMMEMMEMVTAMEILDDGDLDKGLLHQCEQLEQELTECSTMADKASVMTALEGDAVALEEPGASRGTSANTSVETSAEVVPAVL